MGENDEEHGESAEGIKSSYLCHGANSGQRESGKFKLKLRTSTFVSTIRPSLLSTSAPSPCAACAAIPSLGPRQT